MPKSLVPLSSGPLCRRLEEPAVNRNTIANILKRNGIESAPDRVRKNNLERVSFTQHWELLVEADFYRGRFAGTYAVLQLNCHQFPVTFQIVVRPLLTVTRCNRRSASSVKVNEKRYLGLRVIHPMEFLDITGNAFADASAFLGTNPAEFKPSALISIA
jgi:hypothetical protein